MSIFRRPSAGLAGALLTTLLAVSLSGCSTPQPRELASESPRVRSRGHELHCAAYETRFCKSWGLTLDCTCVDPRKIQIHG